MYILSIKVEECIWGLQVRYGQYRPHYTANTELIAFQKYMRKAPIALSKVVYCTYKSTKL